MSFTDHHYLLLILFLIPILVYTIRRKISSTKSKLPPCPPKLPLIGNLHQMGTLPHQSLHALSVKYGPLMLLKLGQIPTLIVSSADMAREIMKTHDHIFASRPSLMTAGIILYGSMDVVFAPYGEHWRQMRKLCVNHLLSPKAVQSFRRMHEEEVATMVAKISEVSSSSGVVNMSETLNLFASNAMLKAISRKLFRDERRSRVICELNEETAAILGQFSVSDFMPLLAWFDMVFGVGARAKKTARLWDRVLHEIIEDCRNRRDSEVNTDFVNVLLALLEDNDMDFSLNKDIIKAVLQDMIAAGTETSSTAMDWCMAELVRNPEAMKKLQDEVRGIANTKPMITDDDLSKMGYLKAVIKELLRLHPPVPLLIPRESMDHCEVQGFDIPKQTRVIVNAWSIGRDPNVWEAPEEFRPERFLDCAINFRGHDFELIPFGAGRRICPGMQFAVSTLELALANLVRSFDWELPDGMNNEDLGMGDGPGLSARRRQSLLLVAKPFLGLKCM
uniref:Cytochrome P450 n=1 Tax=Muscari armeniacum TaxID=156613 RepID=Q75T49_MUSAR|nr:cytochrome P450 [Muscari armeniacum]BAD16680.1 cytochrome P450 [Muscari armeniacum]